MFVEHNKTMNKIVSLSDINNLGTKNKSSGDLNSMNPEILFIDNRSREKSIVNRIVSREKEKERERASPPHVVINYIQRNDQEQKMIQPSAHVKSRIQLRNISPRNDKSTLPVLLNQEPISPTQRFCFATKRNSISPNLKTGKGK